MFKKRQNNMSSIVLAHFVISKQPKFPPEVLFYFCE